ncbi:hypothetical protein [Burkholderia lata]|uniref:hypothetical protein n=1 Tax=Burkholderia lata (strain ATCC 17760 / DSM 23089 / LMG 22485 / NCIMB 9086 / R18194 / 383) TaxID=482957 RepID=UPI001582A1A6|nr:hypothetical protein [Burkholderia lata]
MLDTEHTHACPFAPYRKYCRLLFLQPVSQMNPSLHWQSFCRAKVADLVVANLVGAFILASRLVRDRERLCVDFHRILTHRFHLNLTHPETA